MMYLPTTITCRVSAFGGANAATRSLAAVHGTA